MFIYRGADTPTESSTRYARRRWHAVAVVGTAEACAAARACKDRRYLSVEAPRLPLAGCDARCCDCRYAHFEDRRRGPRRSEEKTGAPSKRVSVDQRERRGRRAGDHATD